MERLYKGSTIVGSNGNKYKIDKLISQGTGQGDVYKVLNERMEVFALKLFHPGKRKRKLEQIQRLIKRGQASAAFVTPLEMVDVEGRVGYIMEFIGQGYENAAILVNGIMENGRVVNLPWHEKIALIYQIVDAFAILTNAKLGVMDIKFDNILVSRENLAVKILDTDTIVSKNDKSFVLGTVGFMPPNTHTHKESPNEYNDAYAIAVLIFMSLMGVHPLDGKRRIQPCNENIDTYLFGTHPVYMFHPSDTSNRPIPQDGFGRNQQLVIDKFARYPQYFKDAMQKTFVDGLYDGSKRTTMQEWCEILEKMYNDSFICENCGEEYFIDNNDKTCAVCKQDLKKPVFLCSESGKSVPLFYGLTIFSNDISTTTTKYEVFKVVQTKYDGRYGLENLLRETAILKLPNGIEQTFGPNEAIPIFMDSEIIVENQTLKFI